MQISAITQATVADQAARASSRPNQGGQAAKQAASSTSSPTSSVAQLVQPYSVSPSVLQQAAGDGDGRTGVAALNDGDAAAQAAAVQARSINFLA